MTGNREQQITLVEALLRRCALDPTVTFREMAQQVVEYLLPETNTKTKHHEKINVF